MSSSTKEPVKNWKRQLLAAKKMQGSLGVTVYRRTTLLNEVFADAEFRADIGARDDEEAGRWLDVEFTGVALTFLQLRYLLEHYPEECQWAKGDFLGMYRKLREPTAAGEEKPKVERERVTKAMLAEAEDGRKHWKTRAEYLEKRVAELEAERTEHVREIARLEGRLVELERLIPARALVA